MEIVYEKEAVKSIKKLDRVMGLRVKKAIEALPDGDVKKLKGYDDIFRLRVGNYRIIYKIVSEECLLIIDVAPRGGVYKRI